MVTHGVEADLDRFRCDRAEQGVFACSPGERGGGSGALAQFGEGDLPVGAGQPAYFDPGAVVDEFLPVWEVGAYGGVLQRERGQHDDGGGVSGTTSR
ncbi:hypothetical protein [Streptomyces sp. NPDC001076]